MGNFADFAIIPAEAYEEIMRLEATGHSDDAADLIIDLLDAEPEEGCDLCGDELSRTRLGEYWHGVLALLTGADPGGATAADAPDDPRRQALMGEHEFFADAHYGVVSPERVVVVKQALEAVDADAAIDDGNGNGAKGLRGLLGRRRQRIHGVACDYPVRYVRDSYEALVDIYRDAASRGAGVVIALG